MGPHGHRSTTFMDRGPPGHWATRTSGHNLFRQRDTQPSAFIMFNNTYLPFKIIPTSPNLIPSLTMIA